MTKFSTSSEEILIFTVFTNIHYFFPVPPYYLKTRLPALRSSSVGPEGCFLFFHPKVKGGEGVECHLTFDKNENYGLEMHFKSFEVFLVYAFFYPS